MIPESRGGGALACSPGHFSSRSQAAAAAAGAWSPPQPVQGVVLAALLHSDARAMPSDGAGPLAENFARILSERASFELREEDVHAYQRRLSSLQHAVQVSAAARAQEDEEYRQWQVSGGPGARTLLRTCHQGVLL